MRKDELQVELEKLYSIERELPPVDPREAWRTLSRVGAAICQRGKERDNR